MAFPVPPLDSTMVLNQRKAIPFGAEGAMLMREMKIVPENPPMLVAVIEVFAELPWPIERAGGIAEKEKSGEGGGDDATITISGADLVMAPFIAETVTL